MSKRLGRAGEDWYGVDPVSWASALPATASHKSANIPVLVINLTLIYYCSFGTVAGLNHSSSSTTLAACRESGFDLAKPTFLALSNEPATNLVPQIWTFLSVLFCQPSKAAQLRLAGRAWMKF